MDKFVTRTKKRTLGSSGRPEKDVGEKAHQEEGGLQKKSKVLRDEEEEREESCPSADEFSDPLPWQKIEAEGLDLDYTVLFPRTQADRLFKQLEEEVEYFSGERAKVQVFGKFYNVPRKQATYGDPGLLYSFSGVHLSAKPWTAVLEQIRDAVTKATGHIFNFVLVNRYKDGQDHIGEHRDDERELDPTCPIASVSLGAARDFVRRIPPVKLELQHGSLLLMNPPTNTYWYHSLPTRKRVLAPRVNLTFRRIVKTCVG
ncbi:ALKB2 demethylase, partial [Amia calva]|nr:ALKB2 demethylase [Amia calva]